MSVVWIVEKPKTGQSAAMALLGDHAVRLFASFDSFCNLIHIGCTTAPHLILLDVCDLGVDNLERAVRTLEEAFPMISKVFLFAEDSLLNQQAFVTDLKRGGNLVAYRKPINALQLSEYASYLMRAQDSPKRQGGSIQQFKDIELDIDKFKLRVVPQSELQSLSLKEARLLRLFIENPGICLSRHDIQQSVWDSVRVASRTIDSHVSRLRRHLVGSEVNIESIYGGGYIMT